MTTPPRRAVAAPSPGTWAVGGAQANGEVSAYEHRKVNAARLAATRAHAGASILDVGCGSAAYVLALQHDHQIVGIDRRDFPTWREAKGRLAIVDAEELGAIRSHSVDTVLLFEVLEHLQDPGAALREAHRICRKNVILSVPNAELTSGLEETRLIYFHWIDRTHVQFFTESSLRELGARAGFRIESVTRINEISLAPLIREAFALGRWGRLIERALLRRQRVRYEMTLLGVLSRID